MKKITTMMMVLMIMLTMTQCKKQVDDNDGQKVRVCCVVPMNKGGKSDFTNLMADGSIKWSAGTERIYLAIPDQSNPQIVELTTFTTVGSDILAFEGEALEGLIQEGEYDVWYLGNSKNLDVPYISETKEGDAITGISGSIATQSGSIDDLGYCHIAKTTVTAETSGEEVVLSLNGILKNQIAIAHLDLKDITNLKGDAVIGTEYALQYNEGTNKFDFAVTVSDTANINITEGTATSYVVLLPNATANVDLKSNTSKKVTFEGGVEANRIYYKHISDMEYKPLVWEDYEEEEPEEPDEPEEPTAPVAPTNLVATATGQTTISLTWDAVQNATSYNVYSNDTVVASDLTVTSYTVEGLTAGTEYCYNVTAVNEVGESDPSTEACATTELPPIVVETITVNGVSFNMIQVEGGGFTMGHDSENYSSVYDEEPHYVELSNFSVGETEVTQELWMAVTGKKTGFWWKKYGVYSPNNPAECFSWDSCQIFINKLNELTGKNFRLPTEAEWEYAARGGHRATERHKYSGSNNIDDVAWYAGNKDESQPLDQPFTHEVKTKAPNELGVYDMTGNVWELCSDWYDREYYYNSPVQDPQGPETGEAHVIRGGGWSSEAVSCRVANRECWAVDETYSNQGFRLVYSR